MIRKPKDIFISLLVVVLITALFFSTSCDFIESVMFHTLMGKTKNVEKGYEEALKEVDLEELEEEDREEERKQWEEEEAWERERKEKEQAAEEAELLEGFEEEEKLIPDESVTYSGEFDGISIVMTVDFKTTAVSGSLDASGDYYLSAGIEGTINIETFKINANFSGIMGASEAGIEEPWNGTINGEISEDLSTFNGDIKDDEDYGTKFIATR